jgi:urease accessory protein UreE
MDPLAWLGALGGIVVFSTAMVAVVRGIFRQVHTVEDNTKAINELKSAMEGLGHELGNRLNNHGERIATLEGMRTRR